MSMYVYVHIHIGIWQAGLGPGALRVAGCCCAAARLVWGGSDTVTWLREALGVRGLGFRGLGFGV